MLPEVSCDIIIIKMCFFSGQGSPGCLRSSVEHSQLSSTVTSQTYEGCSFQRRHIQSE